MTTLTDERLDEIEKAKHRLEMSIESAGGCGNPYGRGSPYNKNADTRLVTDALTDLIAQARRNRELVALIKEVIILQQIPLHNVKKWDALVEKLRAALKETADAN